MKEDERKETIRLVYQFQTFGEIYQFCRTQILLFSLQLFLRVALLLQHLGGLSRFSFLLQIKTQSKRSFFFFASTYLLHFLKVLYISNCSPMTKIPSKHIHHHPLNGIIHKQIRLFKLSVDMHKTIEDYLQTPCLSKQILDPEFISSRNTHSQVESTSRFLRTRCGLFSSHHFLNYFLFPTNNWAKSNPQKNYTWNLIKRLQNIFCMILKYLRITHIYQNKNQKRMDLKEIQVYKESKFEQTTNFLKIRVVTLPRNFGQYQYYSKQNLLLEENYSRKVLFYSINGDVVQFQRELSKNFNSRNDKNEWILFLDNSFIIKQEYKFLKFNLVDISNYQSFNIVSQRYIWDHKQINKKSYITNLFIDGRLRIHSLKNLKRQSTISSRFIVDKITYCNCIVQSKTDKDIYYFNQQMSKQIRKFCRFIGFLHEFNSNYLFEPIIRQKSKIRKLIQIKIYDICTMKLKGTLQIKNRKYEFHSYLFINDVNILAVLYTGKVIDLYDLSTLKMKRRYKLNQGYQSEIRYDKENGMTIFQWPNIISEIRNED